MAGRSVSLEILLRGLEVRRLHGRTDRAISGLAYHSAGVREGNLFVAMRGVRADGHRYLEDAVTRGAAAVVVQEPVSVPASVTVIEVAEPRRALAALAAAYYGDPSAGMTLVGITGTNGKTTTSFLLESIFQAAGGRPGVIGTVTYRYGQTARPASVTTPESLDLQHMLREMADAGVTHVAMEVSSHALDMHRADSCQFDCAIFTNLTQDHLDYHGSLDEYWRCKARLFTELLSRPPKGNRATAVLNLDDPRGAALAPTLPVRVLTFGMSPEAQVTPRQFRFTPGGTDAVIATPQGELSLRARLLGEFNLFNMLGAIGAGVALGIPLEAIRRGIEALASVPGRLEAVGEGPFTVVVDYAHTPDALERILKVVRGFCQGRLITLFGCGGDRDRTKRPIMGRVAATLSDLVVITSDNPRTEVPEKIIEEIVQGLPAEFPQFRPGPGAERGYTTLVDRRQAIRLAIALARPKDAVVLAGKGHEDYQILGTQKHPFDDREEARRALQERGVP
ncbi:MAG: UDP-N-acetylmuramoyl-L-alanyl-D-glutamate--2,6-diaminopimelate ligase [Deltaproteobacteria bacterium]|nr:UDP-N-acetylmuramoyl-L-alanyl-D-glutamate--2,6-diaminopimelate ligase [Deltaproteobacteria bacterium]